MPRRDRSGRIGQGLQRPVAGRDVGDDREDLGRRNAPSRAVAAAAAAVLRPGAASGRRHAELSSRAPFTFPSRQATHQSTPRRKAIAVPPVYSSPSQYPSGSRRPITPRPGNADLARARVPDGVVAVAVAVGQVGETAGAGAEGVRGAGAGEAAHDVAGPDRALLRLPAGRARRLLEVHAVAVEHDEELLAAAVAVRRRAELAGGDGRSAAAPSAARRPRRRATRRDDAQSPRSTLVRGHVREVHDGRRPPRRRVRHLQLADRRLLHERMRRVAGGDPAAARATRPWRAAGSRPPRRRARRRRGRRGRRGRRRGCGPAPR